MERELLVGKSKPNSIDKFNLQHIYSNKKSKLLWLFGVDADGFSVSVRVFNFQPVFYIRNKNRDPDLIENLMDQTNELLRKDAEDHICKIEHVSKRRFVGAAFVKSLEDKYVYKKYKLLKVTCTNVLTYNRVLEALKNDPEKWDIHDDFDVSVQFLQQIKSQYQSWIDIQCLSREYKMTHCNFDVDCDISKIKKSESQEMLPRILKCFVNVACISRDGVVDNSKKLFRPNPSRIFDRPMVTVLTYAWSDNPVPVKTIVLNLMDNCQDEKELYEKLQKSFIEFDPDVIFHFPGDIHSMLYLAKRATCCNWERLKNLKVCHNAAQLSLNTRILFDLRQPIIKKASVLIETYDLHTVSCHPEIRKKPEDPKSFHYTHYDFHTLIRTNETQKIIVKEILRDNELMVSLETDCNLFVEYANISKISNCPIYDTVSRGEQIRVFNKLIDFTGDDFYINKAELVPGPVRFPISERPPTFPDLPEAEITTRLRTKCIEKLNKNLKKLNSKPVVKKVKKIPNPLTKLLQTMKDVEIKEEVEEETYEQEPDIDEEIEDSTTNIKEGGNVVNPCPGFWKSRILLLDFASLYPNIMRAFHISYENIVTNLKYMDLPGINYIFVPINPYETVAIVDEPGVFCDLLATLIQERSKVKKLMNKETHSFKKTNYNKQQESLKVICNATYGFTGAEDRGSILSMKAVMYIVTALGRYLQIRAARYLADNYGMEGIYGDTDSVFANPGEMNPKAEEMVQFTNAISKKYKMMPTLLDMQIGKFFTNGFTWDAVVNYYKNRDEEKFRVDLTTKDPSIMCNGVMFLVYHKLAHEVSGIFRPEINMEFENMVDNLFMSHSKKKYAARKWSPDMPHQPDFAKKYTDLSQFKNWSPNDVDQPYLSYKCTGMASKKRDWCLFTRELLKKLTNCLATNQPEKMKPLVIEAMNELADGKVDPEKLQVSCKFKGKAHYKNYNSKQLQIVLKLESRHRCEIEDGTRINFIILQGEENLYLRAETPEFVKENNCKIDLKYYLVKQFYKPVKELFTYHPIDFDKEFQKVLNKVIRKSSNMADISDLTTSKPLSISDLQQKPKKKKPNTKKPLQNKCFANMKTCTSLD
jgi:DNA polymerase elongation subunit (family B)